MIVFAAFTPHSPLLLPNIGKEHREQLTDTLASMKILKARLKEAAPETIVIIASHAHQQTDAFSINAHEAYGIDMSLFGDHSPYRGFKPDLALVDAIQRSVRREGIAVTLDSEANLTHGSAVPLTLLCDKMPKVRLIPIAFSGLSKKAHAQFGRALKEVLIASGKRIALIASGDLSHALSSTAPAGLRGEGALFDAAAKSAIEHLSLSKLLAMKEATMREAVQCAYEPLVILFGALERLNVRPEILSYEAPFGVGLLAAQFHLA